MPFDAAALNLRAPARPTTRMERYQPRADFGKAGETTPLFAGRERRFGTMDLSTSIFLCAVVSLWIMVIVVIGALYWSFTSSAAEARDAMKPYFQQIVNHSMSILRNVDGSSVGAHDVINGARTVSNVAVPALQTALNQTSSMITRLEQLAQHPVLQLSLTQGAVGPAR